MTEFERQTARAIEAMARHDDDLKRALTFLARRVKALDGRLGIDSAQEAREGRTGKAVAGYVTKVMGATNKPRMRHTGAGWVPSESMRAAGAAACKRLGVPSVRWSIDKQAWVPAP